MPLFSAKAENSPTVFLRDRGIRIKFDWYPETPDAKEEDAKAS